MQIEKSEKNNITTLKVSGEVDLHASPELRAQLQKCVSEQTPVLLVDFSDVEQTLRGSPLLSSTYAMPRPIEGRSLSLG